MKVNYGEKREIDLRDLCLKLEHDFIFRSEASYHEPFILVLENFNDFLEGEKIVVPEM